ncbi:methyl-accepting chemotaxis protein [Shimia sp. R9_3]|uniref:methyl-accepting chemotaxis protein n=1 Tax=Shimia sp. R9_3 TaxID=2821113 RepID=UPI001ADB22E0|nr:methyl-accepting chemotaxis protein [Shimia sp. R9_3]MBO9402551.1 hypothetical protein [Shimia sp. R9_3]
MKISNVTSGKRPFTGKFQMRLATRILAWVIGPMILLSAIVVISIWNAHVQSSGLLSQKSLIVDSNRLLTQNSNNVTNALLNINRAMVQMENTRRANLAADRFAPEDEAAKRADLQKSIRAYLKGIIGFASAIERTGLPTDQLEKHILYLTRAAGQIDRLASLYTVSNSRTLRLASAGDFQAARNNFRFEELLKTKALRRSLDEASIQFSALSDRLMLVQSEVTEAQIAAAKADQKQRETLSYIALAITAFVAATAALVSVHFGIIRPIRAVPALIERAGQQESGEQSADTATRNDEIGDILNAVSAFGTRIEQQQQLQQEEAEQRFAEQKSAVDAIGSGLSQLSQGDLSARIAHELPEGYQQLGHDFNNAIERLSETVRQVVDSTISISNGASEINQASTGLAHRTESQAVTLEETAAALATMTETVRTTADNARSVEENTLGAQQQAEESSKVVHDAVEAMTNLQHTSDEISQIIGVIDDIAFQTNLLALNAGVEAARAGEAGRGFAVVASEVRALALKSANAALQINARIKDSAHQIENGVDLVSQAGDAINGISTRINEITQLISGIAEGASEQSVGLDEINVGMSQLDNMTQKNAAMVEEATAAIQMVASDVSNLEQLVRFFQTDALSSASQPSVANAA